MRDADPQVTPNRLIAVGDIHGQLDKLMGIIDQIGPTKRDGFVFLGDYVDRGPKNVETVDYLIEFGNRFSSIFLRGNHEQMLLDYLNSKDEFWFGPRCGGTETLTEYYDSKYERIPEHHIQFFEKTRLSFSWKDYIFVHAGLRPKVDLKDQDSRDLLWIRDDFLRSPYNWDKTIVYGHTPQPEPLLLKRRIGLDTGAAYGDRLSACDVLKREIWSST